MDEIDGAVPRQRTVHLEELADLVIIIPRCCHQLGGINSEGSTLGSCFRCSSNGIGPINGFDSALCRLKSACRRQVAGKFSGGGIVVKINVIEYIVFRPLTKYGNGVSILPGKCSIRVDRGLRVDECGKISTEIDYIFLLSDRSIGLFSLRGFDVNFVAADGSDGESG